MTSNINFNIINIIQSGVITIKWNVLKHKIIFDDLTSYFLEQQHCSEILYGNLEKRYLNISLRFTKLWDTLHVHLL